MTRNKSSSPSGKGKGEKPATTPHSPNIFKFGGYECGGGGKTKKVPVDVKEKKGGSSDSEWEPFPMDDFEKALPYDPNNTSVAETMKTYPLANIRPSKHYGNLPNPGNFPLSTLSRSNKKPKPEPTKPKLSKQEKTEQYYTQEDLDEIRSKHLNAAKPFEGDIEEMDEMFLKFKGKNHKEKTELDKKYPRFKEDKPKKKYYDDGSYTINAAFGTFQGSLKKDDIAEEEREEDWHVTQHYKQLEWGTTPSQLMMKHCKCDTPPPVEGMQGYGYL